MAVEKRDIIRHEDTTTFLPSTSKKGQVTFENDGKQRQRRQFVVGDTVLHWTPDENFTSDLVQYTNEDNPNLTTVKDVLDLFINSGAVSLSNYYLGTEAEVLTYYRMSRDIPNNENYSTVTLGLTSADTEFPLIDFATEENDPAGGVSAGTRNYYIYCDVSNITGTTQIIVRGYKRTQGGVETEIYSGSAQIKNLTPGLTVVSCTLQDSVEFATGDRFVLKLAAITTLTNSPIVNFYWGGDNRISYCQAPNENSLWSSSEVNYIPFMKSLYHLDNSLLYNDSQNSRIGVGTTTPAATLDINGGLKLIGNIDVSSPQVNGTQIQFNMPVGFGTSPSPWKSGYRALEFGKFGIVYSNDTDSQITFATNCYLDSNDKWIAKETAHSSRFTVGPMGLEYRLNQALQGGTEFFPYADPTNRLVWFDHEGRIKVKKSFVIDYTLAQGETDYGGAFCNRYGYAGMITYDNNTMVLRGGAQDVFKIDGTTSKICITTNVGIGTTNPIEELHVEGNVLVNGITKTSEIRSATNLALYSDGADETISTNGATLLVNSYNFTVESSTTQFNSAIVRIGVGNSAPTQDYKLIVSGNSSFSGKSNFQSDLEVTGNIAGYNNDLTLLNLTNDGDDFRILNLAGGGSSSVTRGGFITISGNEETSNPGSVVINAGNGNGYVSGNVSVQNGNFGIGTYSPTQVLDVVGNARFRSIGSDASSGALYYAADGTLTTNASDARLKHDIKDLDELTLQKLLDLRPVSFKWNGSDVDSLGLIAQEVQEVFPELVFTNSTTGFLGVRYELLNSILLKALQQQNKKIENILQRLEKLEG